MEFASEMVIRAARGGLEIRELPIALHPREGQSKLSPFRDGWRALRLMLVYEPNSSFLFPGLMLGALGALLMGLSLVHAAFFGDLYSSTRSAARCSLWSGLSSSGSGFAAAPMPSTSSGTEIACWSGWRGACAWSTAFCSASS